ncbi:MAG: hypothetical protein AB7F59_04410 [Bdellovibrionales bacterium]
MMKVIFLALLISFYSPVFAQETVVPTFDPWTQFVENQWNKSMGLCLMGDEEYAKYQTEWQNFRIISAIRYELLLKHWFKRDPPKQNNLEIDSAFQFQKLEPYMIAGISEAEKISNIDQAILHALELELPSASPEEFRKRFGFLKANLTAYLQVLNKDSLMAAPYNGHEGFSILYQNLWKKKAATSGSWSLENYRVSAQDLKSVDAMARTLWLAGNSCKEPQKGAYQALARIMIDRSKFCQDFDKKSIEYCSSDRRLKDASPIEKVIAKANAFEVWRGGLFEQFPQQNKKKSWVRSFYKLSVGNPSLQKALCPTALVNPEQLAQLKQVYVLALKAHLETTNFEKQWVWGANRKLKSKIKAVTQILDSTQMPPLTYDLKKNSTSQCQLTSFVQEP